MRMRAILAVIGACLLVPSAALAATAGGDGWSNTPVAISDSTGAAAGGCSDHLHWQVGNTTNGWLRPVWGYVFAEANCASPIVWTTVGARMDDYDVAASGGHGYVSANTGYFSSMPHRVHVMRGEFYYDLPAGWHWGPQSDPRCSVATATRLICVLEKQYYY